MVNLSSQAYWTLKNNFDDDCLLLQSFSYCQTNKTILHHILIDLPATGTSSAQQVAQKGIGKPLFPVMLM